MGSGQLVIILSFPHVRPFSHRPAASRVFPFQTRSLIMCRPFPLVVNRSSPHSTSSQTHQTDRSWHSRGQGQCFVDPSPTLVSSFSVGCSPGRNHPGDEARRCLRGTSFDSHSAQVSEPPCDVDDRRGLVFPGQDRLAIFLQTSFPAIPPDATPVVRGPRRL